MKKFIIFFVSVLFITYSCNKEKEPENKTFMVLFDISKSTNTQEIIDHYIKCFSTVLEKIDDGDHLVVGIISDQSLSLAKLPVNYALEPYKKKTDNPMFDTKDRENFNKKLVSIKDSLFNEVSMFLKNSIATPYTDIFGALLFAEKVFSPDTTNKKVLVMFSDMMQSDKLYNFDRQIPDKKSTESILKDLTSRNLIAQLKDVRVYISGANAGNTARFNKLQYFWVEYFKAAKADFTEERFCSTLIKFDE